MGALPPLTSPASARFLPSGNARAAQAPAVESSLLISAALIQLKRTQLPRDSGAGGAWSKVSKTTLFFLRPEGRSFKRPFRVYRASGCPRLSPIATLPVCLKNTVRMSTFLRASSPGRPGFHWASGHAQLLCTTRARAGAPARGRALL
jgi:hypothetical protein